MRNHAAMESGHDVASRANAQARNEGVNETRGGTDKHGGAEGDGCSHMLGIGFADRFRMVSEQLLEHFQSSFKNITGMFVDCQWEW